MTKRNGAPKDEFDLTLGGHPPFQPRGANQADYYRAMRTHSTVIGLGPAGSGKTYVAANFAAEQVALGRKKKLILSRPAVAIEGEEHGFLPGDLIKKMAPWTAPVLDVVQERIGKDETERMLKDGRIQVIPLGFMRGRTFNDAIVLLDEAQNTTQGQMKAILTRHGENTTYIIDGDPDQCDLGRGVENGLEHVVWMVNHFDLPVAVVRFTERDCVRSAECRMWVNAFKRMEEPVLPRFVTGVAANSR